MMSVDIETLGLKSKYSFKETHISTSREIHDIHKKLRDFVAPAIRKLEGEGLINGFHHIIHEHIDLRLSCDDWLQHEPRIKEILMNHLVPADLSFWELKPPEHRPECYGGKIGILLCYNNLECNSRLTLGLIELLDETDDERIREELNRLCPHQWLHYLRNQFGHLKLDQINFELRDGLAWLGDYISRHSENPQATSLARNIIDNLRKRISGFERILDNMS